MLNKLVFYKIILILFVSLLIASCESSTDNNPSPESTAVFPNEVGDEWIYAVHDSVSNSTDTLRVNIIGTVRSNGKNLKIWVRKSQTISDTFYVTAENNTVYFYAASDPNVADQTIEFPLVVGKYWLNPGKQFDSTIVRTRESVTVPTDTYPDAFRLERRWGSFNIYGNSTTWFADNVGIVKLYRRIYGFDNVKETWELLSYTVL